MSSFGKPTAEQTTTEYLPLSAVNDSPVSHQVVGAVVGGLCLVYIYIYMYGTWEKGRLLVICVDVLVSVRLVSSGWFTAYSLTVIYIYMLKMSMSNMYSHQDCRWHTACTSLFINHILWGWRKGMTCSTGGRGRKMLCKMYMCGICCRLPFTCLVCIFPWIDIGEGRGHNADGVSCRCAQSVLAS